MAITDPKILEFLKAPLSPKRIQTRRQGGREVSYLEGHDVIACANYVFGYGKWGHEVLQVELVQHGNVAYYVARVRLQVENCVPITDEGICPLVMARGATEATVESHDTARKGAITDGMKRCLRVFGNQFGNSLYAKD
jgi:DNA repair and recombination protein RAD52